MWLGHSPCVFAGWIVQLTLFRHHLFDDIKINLKKENEGGIRRISGQGRRISIYLQLTGQGGWFT